MSWLLASQANGIGTEEIDRLLLCLCEWPMRGPRGHFIDIAPLFGKILDVMDRKLMQGKPPGLSVWSTFVDRLSRSARSDNSLWPSVNGTFTTMLKAYPFSAPDAKLLDIGLEIAESTADTSLAAEIIRRVVANSRTIGINEMSEGLLAVSSDSSENAPSSGQPEGSDSDIEPTTRYKANHQPVPHQAFRKALNLCLRLGDSECAASILEHFEGLSDSYPLERQADLYGLVLLCYSKLDDFEKAKEVLFTMLEKKMEPK